MTFPNTSPGTEPAGAAGLPAAPAPTAAAAPATVPGRERELALVERFVAGVAEGPTALVVAGDPGIGKTTVWRAGVERCRAAGVLVLPTRGLESEMPLAFAGLADLLDAVPP